MDKAPATAEGVKQELERILRSLLAHDAGRLPVGVDVREPFARSRGSRFVVQMRLLVWKGWIVRSRHLVEGALREQLAQRFGPLDIQFMPWVFIGDDTKPPGLIAAAQKNTVAVEEHDGFAALRFMPTMPPSLDIEGNEFPDTIRSKRAEPE